MRNMNGLDRMFMNVESKKLPMDNVGVFLLDPSTSPDRHDYDRVRAELAACVPRIEIFTRRPVAAPFGAGGEQWVTDPDFSIDRHIGLLTTPSCDVKTLEKIVLEQLSTPLPRDRPLWALRYVEGAEGRAALLLRVHHALLDGVGGMEMLTELLSFAPEEFADSEVAPVVGERVPGSAEMLIRSVPIQIKTPFNVLAAGVPLAGSVLPGLVRATVGRVGVIGSTPKPAPTTDEDTSSGGSVPRTVFNDITMSGARSLSLMSVSMNDIIRIKKRHNVTVNDVVLAIVSGGVHDYLRSRGMLPDQPLRIAAPVNVRDEDASGSGGNHFAFMMVPIRTDLADPVEQLLDIAAQTVKRRPSRKSGDTAKAPSPIAHAGRVLEALPSSLWAAIGQVVATPALSIAPPFANYVVSNIPGPPIDLYFAGARITHLYGRTMAGAGVGLFIHCISYAGKLDFGITALEHLVPDPEKISVAIEENLAALLAVDEPA